MGVIAPGISPLNVYAASDEDTVLTSNALENDESDRVIYVDDVNGNDANDGSTYETLLKTMKAVYGKIPKDNVSSKSVVIAK